MIDSIPEVVKWLIFFVRFHTVIMCSALPSISNGVITYDPDTPSPYNFGTTATHTCNTGFFLEGAQLRTCEGDGSLTTSGRWSATAPACSGNDFKVTLGTSYLIH